MEKISLPHDNDQKFSINLLLLELIRTGRPYIIQGQQHVPLAQHTKPNSLDYFLRKKIAKNYDTAQATNNVIEQLVASGIFIEQKDLVCPDTNYKCQGIKIAG